jgi:hypothetical protein
VDAGSLAALRASQRADKNMRQRMNPWHVPIPKERDMLWSKSRSHGKTSRRDKE